MKIMVAVIVVANPEKWYVVVYRRGSQLSQSITAWIIIPPKKIEKIIQKIQNIKKC